MYECQMFHWRNSPYVWSVVALPCPLYGRHIDSKLLGLSILELDAQQ